MILADPYSSFGKWFPYLFDYTSRTFGIELDNGPFTKRVGVLIGVQPQGLRLAAFMPAVYWLVNSAGLNNGRYLRADRKPPDPSRWCLHRNFRRLYYSRWYRLFFLQVEDR